MGFADSTLMESTGYWYHLIARRGLGLCYFSYQGEDFSRKDFNERLYYIDRRIIVPRNGLPDEEKNGESFRVRLKQFFDLQIAKKVSICC